MNYQHEPRGVFFLIDNKSSYASCEAVQRGFNPLKVPLVVLSEAKSTNGGLILATSPEAKQLFQFNLTGIKYLKISESFGQYPQ